MQGIKASVYFVVADFNGFFVFRDSIKIVGKQIHGYHFPKNRSERDKQKRAWYNAVKHEIIACESKGLNEETMVKLLNNLKVIHNDR